MKRIFLAMALCFAFVNAELTSDDYAYYSGRLIGYFSTNFCLNVAPEAITNEVHLNECVNAVYLSKEISCTFDNFSTCEKAIKWLTQYERMKK